MGLETVIRPIVSTDFRPTPKRVLPPSDDNAITIDGGTAQLINLSHNANYSWSHTIEKEIERTFDQVRIHNPDDDGQFVDDEVMTKTKLRNFDGKMHKIKWGKPEEQDNIELLNEDQSRSFDSDGNIIG